MKSMIIVALALVAVAVAVPVEPVPVEILKYFFDKQPEGTYDFGYESADGSNRKEQGQVKEVLDEDNKPQKVVVVTGSYSYPSVDALNGVETINYFADETGYHASGPSVPKPAERR